MGVYFNVLHLRGIVWCGQCFGAKDGKCREVGGLLGSFVEVGVKKKLEKKNVRDYTALGHCVFLAPICDGSVQQKIQETADESAGETKG